MTQYFHLDESGKIPELSKLIKDLHLAETFEFKFAKTTNHQKKAFFEVIPAVPFRLRAVFVTKKMLSQSFREMDSQTFLIHWITKLTLRASELDIADDVLIVDGATQDLRHALRVEFSRCCKLNGRVRPYKKIVGGDSSREDGLQLADMTVGALARYLQGNHMDYYEAFTDKVVDLWNAP